MVILYGLGPHSRETAKKYTIPMKEIEVIIDNALSENAFYQDKVISWKEFQNHRAEYHASKLVIGAKNRYEEIKKEVLESGLFKESDIVGIEEWAQENFKKEPLLGWYAEEWEQENIKNISGKIGCIPQELLEGARLLCDRCEALDRLPKAGCAVEIGVAFGDFSKEILTRMKPDKFYAVDVFSETDGFFGKDIFKESGKPHYEWYADRFSDYISSGILKMEKGLSWEIIGRFPDKYFDYIYLDAAHDYVSVEKDISQIVRKIKPGGVIQFNDYTFQENYGVIPAVNRMVKDTGSKVLYYCMASGGYADLVVQVGK